MYLGYYQQEEFHEIEKFVKSSWGRDIFAKKRSVNIEDLYTYIEIEIERKSAPELLNVRQQLLKLIQSVLINSEKKLKAPEGEYNRLVSRLNQNDTIITFNWDLLLDNILGREAIDKQSDKFVNAREQYPQYINFKYNLSAHSEWQAAHARIKEPYEIWTSDLGYYLKLHGSVDWFYCSNENCYSWQKVFPLLDSTIDVFCSECHEKLDILIIPPILNKGYRSYPLIRRIWNLASQEIRSASEIIIWGYSLPPTDFYSAWLLRQGREASLEKLVIINPEVIYPNSKKVNDKFVDKFRDLFSDKIPKGSPLLYENFSDYLDAMTVKMKYSIGEIKVTAASPSDISN